MKLLMNLAAIAALLYNLVSPARANDTAMDLLNKIEEANSRAQTLTASLQYRVKNPFQSVSLSGDVSLQKPNLAVVNLDKGTKPFVIMADGQQVCNLDIEKREYTLAHGEAGQAIGIWPISINPVELFFGLRPAELEKDEQVRLLSPEVVGGVRCQVVVKWHPEKVFESTEIAKQFTKFFIEPDAVPRRITTHYVRANAKLDQIYEFTLTNVKVDRPIARVTFALSIPPDAKGPSQPAATLDESLLPVGSLAPDFSLFTPEGRSNSLKETLDGRKAVLINFWGYH